MHQLDRRTFLRAGITTAGALALASCTAAPATPTNSGPVTLRLPGTDVNFPSPFSYGGGTGYVQASYTYDTLLWKDASGQYGPWLATGYDRSPDGRTYTFTLRDGVTWSDGQPFTAQDVAFTFTRLSEKRDQIAPTVISVPAHDNIEEIRATDRLTVTVRLRQPDWTFEQFTGAGGILIMPQHIWSTIAEPGRERDPAVLVGTGPYQLESLELGTGAYLYTARDDYFLGRPAVTRIEHRPVDDALTALLAGEIDQAGGIGPGTGLRPQAVAPFAANPEFRVIEAPLGQTVTALYWNIAAGGALADVRFRQACAHAIDRQNLVTRLFDGAAAPGNPGLIPEGNPVHTAVEQYPYDVARAEQLLDAAGYRRTGGSRQDPDGAPLRFELLVSAAQPLPPVELVVADLAAVGVEANVVAVDLPTFGQRRNAGQTQLSINTFGGTNTDEQPDGLGKVYASTSRSLQRAQGYANPELDALIAQQRTTLDPASRAGIAAQVQGIAARDLPLLPLFYPPLTTIVRTAAAPSWYYTPGGVGGLVPSVNNKHAFVTGRETGHPA